jgi:hypothetical protein
MIFDSGRRLRGPTASEITEHGGDTPVTYVPQVAATWLVLGELRHFERSGILWEINP